MMGSKTAGEGKGREQGMGDFQEMSRRGQERVVKQANTGLLISVHSAKL
jgi:hypothetical protein